MQQWKYVYWWVCVSLGIVKADSFVAPATSVKIDIFYPSSDMSNVNTCSEEKEKLKLYVVFLISVWLVSIW